MAQRTIIAYFDTRTEAVSARDALVAEGIETSDIRLLPEDGSASTYSRGADETAYDHRRDEGGFWASLGTLFLPDEDRYTYAEGLSRGGVALSVTVDEMLYDTVADLLEQYGADDIGEREAEWRSTGWSGYDASSADTGIASGVAAGAALSSREGVTDDGVIRVVEEQLQVGKRVAEGGRVRIRTYVVETPVEAEVELRSTRVTIERRPVDRAATSSDFATGERTLEATERREEAVISKEARVVEEIGLRQQEETRTETISDTVRKTEVEVVDERTGETLQGGMGTDLTRDTTRR